MVFRGSDLSIPGRGVRGCSMPSSDTELAREAILHFKRLLHDATPPGAPADLAGDADFLACRQALLSLRSLLKSFAKGELHEKIDFRGVLAGNLKAMQANMLHLTWQVQQVASGDFTQRVDFMGELSNAFNSMVVQFDSALNELRRSREELAATAKALEAEIEKRESALTSLKESEAKLKYMADHDPLTGVYNRRSYFRLVELELQRCFLAGTPCCIALMDIDHFKDFNDRYGHPEGDKALRHVSGISQANLRAGDMIGRYGGEEFIFFLAEVGAEDGQAAAERIRDAIASSPVPIGEGTAAITASLGVVCVPAGFSGSYDRRLLRRAVKAAGTALYQAKGQGRNRVCFLPLESVPDSSGTTIVRKQKPENGNSGGQLSNNGSSRMELSDFDGRDADRSGQG